MSDPVDKALALWGLDGARCTFIAGRENRVYRVDAAQGRFALRLKRPGYRSPQELRAELDWMAALGAAGLSVPRPIPALSGALLETVAGQAVDLLSWLDGAPLGQSGAPLALEDAPGTFYRLGALMAEVHLASDAWTPPRGFSRCRWDVEGLLGTEPVWGRFWDNPTLDPETRALFVRFRDQARVDLMGGGFETGLIHADLVRENVLRDGDHLHLIDFDDGGYGYRLFDIATTLLKIRKDPDFEQLRDRLITGYLTRRPLDVTELDLFMCLRAVTYVGWIVPRMGEPGAAARNMRFVADAKALCAAYMA